MGSGSHSNFIWEETVKKVGEPAAEVCDVSHYLILLFSNHSDLNASMEDAECLQCWIEVACTDLHYTTTDNTEL